MLHLHHHSNKCFLPIYFLQPSFVMRSVAASWKRARKSSRGKVTGTASSTGSEAFSYDLPLQGPNTNASTTLKSGNCSVASIGWLYWRASQASKDIQGTLCVFVQAPAKISEATVKPILCSVMWDLG